MTAHSDVIWLILAGLGADLFGAEREDGVLGEVEHLLSVVAQEPAGERLFLFGHDDDEVGIDFVSVFEGADGEVFVSVDEFGGMADAEFVEEVFHLVDIAVDESADVARLGGIETEEVDFGVEGFGHTSGERHLLAGFVGAIERHDDAFQFFVEVKIFAHREYGHGGVGDGAVGVFADPVCFEARHAMGADDDHQCLVFDGLLGQLFGHFAFADDVFEFDIFEEMCDALVAAFDFGADRCLVLILLLDVDQAYVGLPAVGDIDSEVNSLGRACGEVESDNDIVHNGCVFFV